MSNDASRPRGAMTTAMSALHAAPRPKVLRVGVFADNTPSVERLFRERESISVGHTERATFAVGAPSAPSHVELFTVAQGRWAVILHDALDGKISLDGTVHTVASLRDKHGPAAKLALDEVSRGKLALGGVTVLFQFVPAPPESPKAQLPSAIRRNVMREMDWRYNASLAVFLSFAASALGYIEYGYDPVVTTTEAEALFAVRSLIRMDPEATPPPPEPPPPADTPSSEAASADAPSSHRSTDHSARPSGPDRRPGPAVPDNRSVDREIARANAMVAALERNTAATLAPLTSNGPGSRTAQDQLANGALMAGNADDLRHTTGVSEAPSAPLRNTVASRVPGGDPLGRSTLLRPGAQVGTLDPVREIGPRTQVVMMPSPDPLPSDPVCRGDAQGVARAIRQNLGGLRSCYERGVRNNPTLAGRVTLTFTLGESGRTTAASARGLTSEVDACIAQALQRIVFPRPACGPEEYEFPVSFDVGGH